MNHENDIADIFRTMTEYKKQKRSDNTKKSTEILKDFKIPFVSKNNGAHLIVADKFDFWPSTGLFQNREHGKKGRGVYNLIKKLR